MKLLIAGIMLFMLITTCSVALADDYLNVKQISKPALSLTSHLGLLEDASQQLTLADIQQNPLALAFKTNFSASDSINVSFSSSAFWLRLNIENSSDRPIEKVIELNHALLKYVDFYWLMDEKIQQTIHTGYALPFENRAYKSIIFAFPVQFPAHSHHVIYLRVATPNALFIEANLWEPLAFQKKELEYYAFQAFYFGAVTIIFLFSLGLALVTKEFNYYVYLSMVFFSALCFLAHPGIGAEYIWPNWPWLIQRGGLIFGSYYLVAQLVFTRRLLNTEHFIPRLDWGLKAFIAMNLIMPALLSINFSWVRLTNITIALSEVFFVVILLIACLKKLAYAPILTLSFSMLTIGAIVRELQIHGLIQSSFYSQNSTQLGSLFELLVISFFLTDRYRLIQKEKLLSDVRSNKSDLKLATEIENYRLAIAFQQTLQDNEEKLSNILEVSPDGIQLSNLDGTITFVSNKTRAMWGYSKQAFLHKKTFDVMDVSSHESFATTIAELLLGHTLGAMNYDMIREDGSHFFCEVNCSLILDIDNKPASILYIQRDVTERIHSAKELELAKNSAIQANQSKSVFVSHMSHELRTPLHVILGYTELLKDDTSLDAEQLDYVEEISKGGAHLLMLIRQMLDITQIESGNLALSLRAENISSIINDCVHLTTPLAKQQDISIRYQAQHELVSTCDRTRLIQLVINLISNAIKYNVKHGTVDISLELNATTDYTIHVIDSGVGIDPKRLAQVFEPFVRLTPNVAIEGTGLGLCISKELIELMGGTIGVKSELGMGSHFWITLPVLIETQEQIAPTLPEPSTEHPETSQHYQVLYIDDNANNLKLVQRMINAFSHFQLSTLQDPTQAITQILLNPPDIILLDIHMPGMSGFDVLAALKAHEQLKSIPVIALTANAMSADIDQGLAAGFIQYLSKPVTQAVLIQAIEQVLGL